MDDPRVERWARSGAMALTGLPDEPLGPPEGLVEGVEKLERSFPGLDALALLGERAALMGLWRRGAVSCGGSCRLLSCGDGFLAVSLPRHEDMEMLPAWVGLQHVPASTPAAWSAVTAALRERNLDVVLAQAGLLGLPVARVGERAAPSTRPAVVSVDLGPAPPRPDLANVIVLDLSALWAGPLCGDLLAAQGATVIKVEATIDPTEPDRGARAFYDLLNGRKQSVGLDFHSARDVGILRELARRADVVIEASRPRALAQLGVHAADLVAADDNGPQVWISITGFGRAGEEAQRIAFGDDAAAAGGLVTWTEKHIGPLFCADAIADPLTGLTAASACLDALRAGGRHILDVSMAAVSANLVHPDGQGRASTLPTPPEVQPSEPRARSVTHRAPDLGADTAHVLATLGIDT